MHDVTFEDRRRHRPRSEGSAGWQESYFLGWVDLESLAGGSHHISLSPGDDTASVWSWLVVGGHQIGRVQHHELPLPDEDLEDMSLSGLRVRAGQSLRELTLEATFDDARAELDFFALCDPLEVTLDVGDAKLGDRHYEAMGSVTGKITAAGSTSGVSGVGWHDHSWGIRHFSSNPSSRWLFAVFGDDLAISAFTFVTSRESFQFGWVYDAGRVHRIRRARFGVTMTEDGVSPRSCDAVVWTDNGRGYRITGQVRATGLTGGEGWFAVDGLTEFECGGRVGQGFLEAAELKTLTPTMRDELGLSLDSAVEAANRPSVAQLEEIS